MASARRWQRSAALRYALALFVSRGSAGPRVGFESMSGPVRGGRLRDVTCFRSIHQRGWRLFWLCSVILSIVCSVRPGSARRAGAGIASRCVVLLSRCSWRLFGLTFCRMRLSFPAMGRGWLLWILYLLARRSLLGVSSGDISAEVGASLLSACAGHPRSGGRRAGGSRVV